MKALSDYVHGKGLKLGIYSDAGYAQLSKEKPQSHKKTRLGKCGWQKQKFNEKFNGLCLNCCFLSQITPTVLLSVRELAANRCRAHLDMKSKMQKLSHLG